MHPYAGYANTCRICLKKDEQVKLTIFDMLNDSITYCDMLSMILHPVPIDMNPILPQNLCQMCKENLVKVYNLRQLCFTSDRWIKSTIYGDVYLNANGFTLGGCPAPNDNSIIETMVIDSDNEDESSTNPNSFLSSFQYSSTVLTPEILLRDNDEELLVKDQFAKKQPVIKPHRCEICRSKFATINGYLRHKLKKHKVIVETCEATKKLNEIVPIEQGFEQGVEQGVEQGAEQGVEQVEIQEKQPPRGCELCSRKFATLNGYLRHKMNKHKDQYKCNLCSVTYSSTKTLKIHLASVKHSAKMKSEIDPDRNYVCEKCQEEFTCIEEYSKHMLKHLAVRMDLNNVVCQKCGRCYSTIHTLKRHQLINHTIGVN